MKLKSKKIKKLNISPKSFFFKNFYKLYFYISVIFLIVFLTIFLNTGYWNNYKDKFLSRLYTSSFNNYLKLPKILIMGIKGKQYNIDNININIKFENVINIEKQRKEALEKYPIKYIFKEVKADIDFGNKKYNARIRLKGDRYSHWDKTNTSSYKIDLRGDKTILGLQKFSLQKPRMKNYIHEWLFY